MRKLALMVTIAGGLIAAGPVDAPGQDDFFRDREDDVERVGLRLVLLRDTGEHPQVTRRADVSAELAAERGIGVTQLRAEGASAVARLAWLIGLTDFASAYLALAEGTDPTPVPAIEALKARIAR